MVVHDARLVLREDDPPGCRCVLPPPLLFLMLALMGTPAVAQAAAVAVVTPVASSSMYDMSDIGLGRRLAPLERSEWIDRFSSMSSRVDLKARITLNCKSRGREGSVSEACSFFLVSYGGRGSGGGYGPYYVAAGVVCCSIARKRDRERQRDSSMSMINARELNTSQKNQRELKNIFTRGNERAVNLLKQ